MSINNIKDLRNDLLTRYQDASTDLKIKDLIAHTQTASAIIRSVKVELDYNKHQGIEKDIDFLEVPE